MSMIMDSKRRKFFSGRKPTKRAHGTGVGTTLVCSELHTKVVAGPEAVGIIKTLLIFAVTAFDLAVVARRVRLNELVSNASFGGSTFK